MKFVLHFDSSDFLACDSCGKTEFRLLPDKKLDADEKYRLFLFYECPNCTGAGFWTHSRSIDPQSRTAVALARCKAPVAAVSGGDKASVKLPTANHQRR